MYNAKYILNICTYGKYRLSFMLILLCVQRNMECSILNGLLMDTDANANLQLRMYTKFSLNLGYTDITALFNQIN